MSGAQTEVSKPANAWLRWLPFGIGAAQTVPCAFLLVASLYRVSIGATSLFAASFAQPFLWFHQDAARLPLFAIAVAGSLFNLYLLWNAHRLRNRPSAAWRKVELTPRERRVQQFQLWSSVLTLLMIAADFASHAWMSRHPFA
jgi:hypothetical protein